MPPPYTKHEGQAVSVSPSALWELFRWCAGFRFPMPVTEVMIFETTVVLLALVKAEPGWIAQMKLTLAGNPTKKPKLCLRERSNYIRTGHGFACVLILYQKAYRPPIRQIIPGRERQVNSAISRQYSSALTIISIQMTGPEYPVT